MPPLINFTNSREVCTGTVLYRTGTELHELAWVGHARLTVAVIVERVAKQTLRPLRA